MSLEEHLVESSSGEYARKVWLLRGETLEPTKLCVFLDAEYYLHHMETPAALRDLQTRGAIPPVTCLFVSHGNGEARHHDYTCNDRYARFIAEELLNWAKDKAIGISERGNVVCGLSLSGLSSAYLSLAYPALFPSALCQSGSFWWNEEWLCKSISSFSPLRRKIWISVGNKETEEDVSHPPTGMLQAVSQITATENIVKELRANGTLVNYHPFSGGHETACWKKELPSALPWLIGK